MQRAHTLFLLFVLALLAACSSVPAQSGVSQPTPTLSSGMRVLLVSPASANTPSQAQLDTVRSILSQRLVAFGLKNAQVSHLVPATQPSFLVEVPHFGGDERGTLNLLLGMGRLGFWDTGSVAEQSGTAFDPTPFAQNDPGERPLFTNQDLDPASLMATQNKQTNQYEIRFAMRPASSSSFSQFTGSHVGDYLTLTLDGKVFESSVISSQIQGPVAVAGTFTPQQATAIVSVLKYPQLPIALQIRSEAPFTS